MQLCNRPQNGLHFILKGLCEILIRPVLIIFMFLVNHLHWKIGTAPEAIITLIIQLSSCRLKVLVLIMILWLEKGHFDNNGIMDRVYTIGGLDWTTGLTR